MACLCRVSELSLVEDSIDWKRVDLGYAMKKTLLRNLNSLCLFLLKKFNCFAIALKDRPVSVVSNGVDLDYFHRNGNGLSLFQ